MENRDYIILWRINSLISCFGLILFAIFHLINNYFYLLGILLLINSIMLFYNEYKYNKKE